MKVKPLTHQKERQKCPLCDENIIIENSGSLHKHLVYDHCQIVDEIIKLYDSSDDFGYFMSILKCELESKQQDEWWNS